MGTSSICRIGLWFNNQGLPEGDQAAPNEYIILVIKGFPHVFRSSIRHEDSETGDSETEKTQFKAGAHIIDSGRNKICIHLETVNQGEYSQSIHLPNGARGHQEPSVCCALPSTNRMSHNKRRRGKRAERSSMVVVV